LGVVMSMPQAKRAVSKTSFCAKHDMSDCVSVKGITSV